MVLERLTVITEGGYNRIVSGLRNHDLLMIRIMKIIKKLKMKIQITQWQSRGVR